MKRTAAPNRRQEAQAPAPWMTVAETAVYLRRHRLHVYELVRQNFFPPGVVARIGRAILFNRGALDEFLANGGKGLENE